LGESFGISESYACKIYTATASFLGDTLHLMTNAEVNAYQAKVLVVDASEQPVERPQEGQKAYYSGKKKAHTMKSQVIIDIDPIKVLSVISAKGSVHDFSLFKSCGVCPLDKTWLIGDLGYYGIDKIRKYCIIPHKASKNSPLSDSEKEYNKLVAHFRIAIEHINRLFKIFRIAKETYRGRRRNFERNWTIIACFVNMRLAST
jgi:hypothetical protein